MLETAETMKQTEDQEPTTLDYEGMQIIESVKDFPAYSAIN